MEKIVSQMRARVEEFNPDEDDQDEQNLYKAFIEFAGAYKTFNDDKNYQNWKRAKNASVAVMKIGSSDKRLTPTMNFIWKHSREFDDILQDKWIYSELDRLNAHVHERYTPHSYLEGHYERSLDKPDPESEDHGTKSGEIPDTIEKEKEKEKARAMLDLQDNATPSHIKNAYYSKSKEFHPEKHPGEESKYTEMQQKLVAAYNALKGGKKRHTQVKRRKPMASKSKKRSKKSRKTKSRRH